ncbi:MAG: PQQ-binding-like beta-propeller repeat protein [Acidobacteriota bacterium]|nr:PQQ-binding-like beta-propeller repeat protein [Acidobacteriota bacterium]
MRIRTSGGVCLLVASIGLAAASQPGSSDDTDWPVYLGPGSSQYTPLIEITRHNVDRLEVAWTYHAGDADTVTNRSQIQTSPIVVDGALYGVSPVTKIFALDAATGERRWEFDPFAHGAEVRRGGTSRGVTFWANGDDRRLFASGGSKLFALDADSGIPIETFGQDGVIDLHDGLDAERDVSDLFVISNTPGVIYKDLLILPTRHAESSPAAPGNIRAFDVRTGDVVWVFHTIPHPGEFGHDTWPADSWQRQGAANNWSGMSVDHERGLVFVPTGSATPDFYGQDREGSNLFANTLLALDAATGERVWHFQAVHHDIWDRDFPAPPNLVTIEQDGVRHDVVAQITKSAHVFMFERDTGESIFPIEERPFPPSDIPGEVAWPTQPLPTKPPPFARQRLTPDEVTDISPEAHRYVLDRLQRMRSDGQFIPTSREGTIILPGLDGGGEWGGAAVDPTTGIMYVNANDMPWIGAMVEIPPQAQGALVGIGHRVYALHCLQCHGVDGAGDELGFYPAVNDLPGRVTEDEARAVIDTGRGYMPSHTHLSERDRDALIAYLFDSEAPDPRAGTTDAVSTEPEWVFAGYRRFLDQEGRPAIKPPWATLNAIDLNLGEILWKVTLGDWPELSATRSTATGAEAYGGPIVTGSGLIFIGATRDERFRVFDTRNGDLLWETALPAAGYATPISYAIDGKQYVVIAAGGGKIGTKSGDAYVAFALP